MARRRRAKKTPPETPLYPRCPTCGGPAASLLQTLLGEAQLGSDGDFSGTTDVDWDSQEDHVHGENGRTFYCEQRHEYTDREVQLVAALHQRVAR